MKPKKGWIVIGIIVVFIAPFLLTQKAFFKGFDFSNTGGIGDTIGGVTAPVVGIISILLLFYTLIEQYKLNIAQSEFNKKQEELFLDEQFKSVFLISCKIKGIF